MLTRKVWNQVYRAARQSGVSDRLLKRTRLPEIDYKINDRAKVAHRLDGAVQDGKLGVIRDGMDCDCVRYHHESIVNYPGLIEFMQSEEEHYSWLDGPETTSYVHPSRIDRNGNYSRDLAMEAHENGHEHVVYY